MPSFQQLPKSIKNDPLHSSRCSFTGKAGVDGKNDSLFILLYSKTEEGIKKE
jgi:hypothetical protein